MEDKDVRWKMSKETIVRKLDIDGSQNTLPKPRFDKMKEGDTMNFDAHVNVEAMPQGKHLKKATIFSNVPGGGTWEIICDEGKAVGGRGSAPSPIMYFATGVALCMMSHVEMLAIQKGIKIKTKLEQRFSFNTTLNLGSIEPKKVFGKGKDITLNLIIDSTEPKESIAEFIEDCIQACMSLQALMQQVPAKIGMVYNETELVVLNDQTRQ